MHTRGVSALSLEVNKQTENLVGGISVYFSTQDSFVLVCRFFGMRVT